MENDGFDFRTEFACLSLVIKPTGFEEGVDFSLFYFLKCAVCFRYPTLGNINMLSLVDRASGNCKSYSSQGCETLSVTLIHSFSVEEAFGKACTQRSKASTGHESQNKPANRVYRKLRMNCPLSNWSPVFRTS